MDNSPVAGAAMYGAVFILLRHFTLESMNSREAKRLLARQLPRPKSFLLSEKAPSAGAKEEVAAKIIENAGIFVPGCTLCLKDSIVIDFIINHLVTTPIPLHLEMLNQQTTKCCFTVSDPRLHSNPLIYASDAFCNLTGYSRDEVILRNCRFLQGSVTDRSEVARISTAIREGREGSACLVNYKKNGEIFANQLFICPLYDEQHNLVYFLGVQAEVDGNGPGHLPENAGWNIVKNV